MLSRASVARSESSEDQGEFAINLKPLPETVQDAGTMRWWQMHPLAWQESTRNQTESKTAMWPATSFIGSTLTRCPRNRQQATSPDTMREQRTVRPSLR